MFHSSGFHPSHDSDLSSSRRYSQNMDHYKYHHEQQGRGGLPHQRMFSEPTVQSMHVNSNTQDHARSVSTSALDRSFSVSYHAKQSTGMAHHHPFPANSMSPDDVTGMNHHGAEPMDIFDSSNEDQHASGPNVTELEVSAAEHLMALLQREANDYSRPLPVCYYPNEFEESNDSGDDKSSEKDRSKAAIIGPWRRRIASWMYDVVDHFKYDRNVVSIALRYIDQYVSHLLLRSPSKKAGPVIKRRHFQLIAVTSLYLAIKIHGELKEEDGIEFDAISALLCEVDGHGTKVDRNGQMLEMDHDEEDDDDDDEDEEIRALSFKIADLRRRQRLERMKRLNPQQPLHPIPFKPRKRGMLSGPLRLSSFVELSRGLFTSQDIIDTEKKILIALNYVVNPPTTRRFVGEMMRILALCTNPSRGGSAMTATANQVGLDRHEILHAILDSTCHQTESASSIPILSIGCLPSVVAYSALLNAIDDVFARYGPRSKEDIDGQPMDMVMGEEKNFSSYELEDFQRHYRRYARSQSAPIQDHRSHSSILAKNSELEKGRYLEAWKEQFLIAVFHSTNCFLSPDSADVFRVRELLLDEVKPLTSEDEEDAAQSPTDKSEESADASPSNKKKSRQPRSPRSVIVGMTSARFKGSNSFFSRNNSTSSSACSPYDASRASFSSISSKRNEFLSASERSSSAFPSMRGHHSHTRASSFVSTASNASANNMINDTTTRAATPDMNHWRNGMNIATAQTGAKGSNTDCWKSEAFQPPPFFSA